MMTRRLTPAECAKWIETGHPHLLTKHERKIGRRFIARDPLRRAYWINSLNAQAERVEKAQRIHGASA